MNSTSLYQQYEFIALYSDELHFIKKKWSSQVRRLPAIYTKLLIELWLLIHIYLVYDYPSKP